MGKSDLAEADYEWLIVHWPGESRFYGERGEFFGTIDQRTRALADYDKALSLAPGYEEARLDRAGTLMSFNRDEEALADVNILIAGSRQRADAFKYRAEIYRKQGRREAALADLDQAFSQDSQLLIQYQQRLVDAGYFQGQPDGIYNEAVRNGAKACLIDPKC